MTNISPDGLPFEEMSRLIALIGQPARIQILLVIGAREVCVCHLEAALNMRQSCISQHLMTLRKANLVMACREGRNIFYHIERPEIITLLQQAAQLAGISTEALDQFARRPVEGCPCPQCSSETNPAQCCENQDPSLFHRGFQQL